MRTLRAIFTGIILLAMECCRSLGPPLIYPTSGVDECNEAVGAANTDFYPHRPSTHWKDVQSKEKSQTCSKLHMAHLPEDTTAEMFHLQLFAPGLVLLTVDETEFGKAEAAAIFAC